MFHDHDALVIVDLEDVPRVIEMLRAAHEAARAEQSAQESESDS